ncbi:transposase [Lysobacter sp. A3-1-A15]|uniref:transposase n=1 Tax=Novilysobacter viscosus TaxID=3098602 RepID=UPI002EDB2169
MPIVIDTEETRVLQLEELIERLDRGLDTRCHDSMLEAAGDLKALSNNRTFLADVVARELKDLATMQRGNTYTPQVVMLHLDPCKNYFLRANIWPSANDAVMQASGPDPFFYHKPHDHNFNFLTVGYHGPGYWSDYYEYDYDKVAGYPGESMGLRFVERSALNRGKVMLYRAFVDVHDQLPADELSISLNIMENTLRPVVTDQYAADTATGVVKKMVNRNNMVCVLSVAAAIGDENTVDIIDHIAHKHVNPRVRFAALKSLGSRVADPDQRIELMMQGMNDDSALVRESSRVEIQKVNAPRQEIEHVFA